MTDVSVIESYLKEIVEELKALNETIENADENRNSRSYYAYSSLRNRLERLEQQFAQHRGE